MTNKPRVTSNELKILRRDAEILVKNYADFFIQEGVQGVIRRLDDGGGVIPLRLRQAWDVTKDGLSYPIKKSQAFDVAAELLETWSLFTERPQMRGYYKKASLILSMQ